MIVTFYSFKGGVGRSMALVNVGEILAERGYEVVLCDWDLEAPGLEQYVVDTPEALEPIRARPGVVDLLQEYKETMVQGTEGDSPAPSGFERVGKLQLRQPSSYALQPSLRRRTQGVLRLLTAGRRDGENNRKYASAVQSFSWSDFYSQWAGGSYIEFWRQDLVGKSRGRIVLIDSRTGVTEQGGVCTHHLADVVVLLTAANQLNLEGSDWMASALDRPELTAVRGQRPIHIVPVASRIEQRAQRDEVNQFRARLLASLGEHIPKELGDPKRFLEATEIPYAPYYSFIERVAAREKDGVRDPGLYRAYEAIADALIRVGVAKQLIDKLSNDELAPTEPDVTATLASHAEWLDSKKRAGARAILSGRNYSRVDFTGRRLDEAVFDGVALRGACFNDASLRGADFRKCDLSFAQMLGANLEEADLSDALLMSADLRRAKLDRAKLDRARLSAADLTNASLKHATFQQVLFENADLEGADFAGAQLVGANLSSVVGLSDSGLGGTNLQGAELPTSAATFAALSVLSAPFRFAAALFAMAGLAAATTLGGLWSNGPGALWRLGLSLPGGISIDSHLWFWAGTTVTAGLGLAAAGLFAWSWIQALRLPAVFQDGRLLVERVARWMPRFPARRAPADPFEPFRLVLVTAAPFGVFLLAGSYSTARFLPGTLVVAAISALVWYGWAVALWAVRRSRSQSSSRGLPLGGGTVAFAGVMFAFSVASALATYAEDRPDFTLQSRCCGKVGFTPNGRSVAAVTLDSILMWDVATARELPGFARIARGMTIETIGPEWQLALRPRRGARRPWGITRLGSLDTTEMFLDSASNPTFVPTGSYVATATPGTLRLWNIGSGKAEERIDQFEPQESVVSFEGGTLITGIGSTVRVRRLGSARASGTIRPDILPTNYAAVLSDYSPHFALIPFGGVEIRSTLDAALVARRASRPSAAFTDVAFLPDGGRALLVLSALDSNKDSLYLWRWSENRGDTAAVLSLIAVSDNFDQLSVSPDGRVLATSESNGTIRLWDTSKWSVLRTVFAHRGGADRMYLSPDGSRLLTMGDHFLLSVWRVPTPSGQDAVQSNPPNARP